jgi:hypothetical protein
VTTFISYLEFAGLLAGVLAGFSLFGLVINVLLFPSMWQQPDVPAWIRWLAGK